MNLWRKNKMANEIIVSNNFLGIPNEEFEKQVKV
jgi:hypothetical protein